MNSRLEMIAACRAAHPAWGVLAAMVIVGVGFVGAARSQDPAATKIADAPETNADLLRKLKTITIARLAFREASVRHALAFLQRRSVELDPAKSGVKIVLKLDPALAPDAASPFDSVNPDDARLTLDVANIPLLEALRYVTSLANLKFKLKGGAVVVVRRDAPEEIVTWEWRLTPAMVAALGNKAGDELEEILIARGISFPNGATVELSEDRRRLVMKNTQENVDLLHALLSPPRADGPDTPERASLKEMERKLSTIIIPWVEFREATVVINLRLSPRAIHRGANG